MKTKARQLTTADLFIVLRRALLLMLACALLCGALGYYMAVRKTKVTYTASSSVYVQAITVDTGMGVASNDIALGRALALSCRDAMKNDVLCNNVKAYFAARQAYGWPDISGMDNDKLVAMISSEVQTNSQKVDITVTCSDGELAIYLANAVADEMERSVISIIGACKIEPSKWAYSAAATSTFSLTPVYAGVVFGAFGAYALVLLLHIFDPRVRNKRELLQLCGDEVFFLGEVSAKQQKGGKRA